MGLGTGLKLLILFKYNNELFIPAINFKGHIYSFMANLRALVDYDLMSPRF